MRIQILNVQIETKPTAKGSYQIADVAYKNLSYDGKVEGKKVMSFGANAEAFKALRDAQAGAQFEVTVVKNDKGYNDWTAAQRVTGEDAPIPAKASSAAAAPSASRGNYETAEERAQRQVFIIRQSSLTNAIATLSVGSKSALKREDVIDLAQFYTDFVLGKNVGSMSNGSGFEDLPSDPLEIPNIN